MIEKYDARRVVEMTMAALKDFQRATVDRVIGLFENGHNRVLVADEVGLGKTVVARGVVARFAELREREGDDLVRIAYICSNQNIASQNLQKLSVGGELPNVDPSESRLSMQHLRIAEQKYSPEFRNQYVQIVPLTPDTSFKVTGGLGMRRERAMMYVILKRLISGTDISEVKLRNRLYGPCRRAHQSSDDPFWTEAIREFGQRVEECEKLSDGKYPGDFVKKLRGRGALELIRRLVDESEVTRCDRFIPALRQLFAEESAAMLEPDLVIMDEFQRFRCLIDPEDGSDIGVLAKRFLSPPDDNPDQKVRVLLLSATPYKLFSTSEEIAGSGCDDQYAEFKQLLGFLFEGCKTDVYDAWSRYSKALEGLTVVGGDVLEKKRAAESELSKGMCRTERVSVMEDGDYISDDFARRNIEIAEWDIAGYVAFSRMMKAIGCRRHLPVEYAKSCPFLMSFLKGYEIKNEIERCFQYANKKMVHSAGDRHLWLRKVDIENFRELPRANARLEALKEQAFQGRADQWMWIPPTIPYYPMEGVYKEAKEYSKILVFSSWEMVPRMISTLLSYEAERRTVKNIRSFYFRNHSQRLREHDEGNEPTAAYEALVDPKDLSWLVGLWDPIATKNAKMDLPAIEQSIREKIRAERGRMEAEEEGIIVDKVLGSPAVCIARRIGIKGDGDAVIELAKIFWSRFNAAVGTAIVEKAPCGIVADSAFWRKILVYCKNGCFQAMFDEYFAVVRDEVTFCQGDRQVDEIVKRMKESLALHTAKYDVDTFNALRNRKYSKDYGPEDMQLRTHFAVGFAKGKDEEKSGIKRKESIRKSFNSPMRPFVLASTSIGQEGLDFHPYCRKIFHWNLPSNPIDLEQREGRINRYKCLAVRENAALAYGDRPYEKDVWLEVYAAAERNQRTGELPELIPYWCFGKGQQVKIERIVPKYPCSRDEEAYDRLIKIVSTYRLAMGQPRQEELLEHVLTKYRYDSKELKKLFINLSPFIQGQGEQSYPCS